jgi:hypothetical protein
MIGPGISKNATLTCGGFGSGDCAEALKGITRTPESRALSQMRG